MNTTDPGAPPPSTDRNTYWTTTLGALELHAYRAANGWAYIVILGDELLPLGWWERTGSGAAN